MSSQVLSEHLRETSSYRLLWALWGGLAVIDAGHLMGLSPVLLLVAVSALLLGCCAHTDVLTALGAAGIVWLLVNGFVTNQLGSLHLVGPGDAVRAAVLVGAALLGTRVAR